MMKNNTVYASIPYDGNTLTSYEGARHLANPTSLGSCQQPYTSADAVPVPSDRMTSMSELMFSYGLDHGCASLPLEQATEPDDDINIFSSSCAQNNPNDPTYSRGCFKFNGSTQLDPMGQYFNNALLNSTINHAGARHDHYPSPLAPAISRYPVPDDMLPLLSTSSNLSHDTPLYQEQNSAKTQLVTSNPITPCMGSPLGYYQSPEFEPSSNADPHGDVVFSAPLLYPSPDRMAQELWRLRLNSKGDIPTHLESDNHQHFILNVPSSYSGPRYSSPDIIHESGQGDPLWVPTLADGHTDYPPSHHPTRTRSCGGHMPTRTQSERTSGHRRGFTSLPYRNPNKTVVNEIRQPDLRVQVDATGHIPDYVGNGQARPRSMHTSAKDSVAASFPTFSENQYNYPTQQTTFWDGVGGPLLEANSTRMDGEHCSGQHPDRAFSSFTQPIYHSEMAVSTPSTSSFPGWRDNGMRSPQFSPKAQLPNVPHPSHTPPFQHIQRQETFECTPDISNPDESSPNSPDTAEKDHSTALSPILADEDRNSSSLSPATHPSIALRAQERLRTILGPSSPLMNESLITLLRLILECSFVWMHEMESRIESEHGQALLTPVKSIPDCPINVLQLSRGSIYTPFVANPGFVCRICGKPKQSMIRAIGCVRSHLDHRPFPCRGTDGCKSCPKDRIVRRFFTASLLHDHRSPKGTSCTSCGATLRSSMKRHWDSQHPDIIFPYDRYPHYRRAKLSHS